MTAFFAAIAFTLGVSFFCSMLEALALSTTVAEIEQLKRTHKRAGRALERLKDNLSDTISTILTLNTISNTLGATLVGGIATRLFGEAWLGVVSGSLTFAILIFSEVIPKNLGVVYRTALQPIIALPLLFLTRVFQPITYLCNLSVRLVIKNPPKEQSSEEEIILLAERSAKQGKLTDSESVMIANALSLDDVRVAEIMTPRTVVTALEHDMTVGDVFRKFKNIPFARIPVYRETIDNIVGLVRRRDLLKAMANDEMNRTVESLMQEVHFIPETVSGAAALQMFLKTHTQLLVVVDEFGSVAGVVTMEDVIEHILGREIFEKDDVAVDMRELARARAPEVADIDAQDEASR
ncbi:MAG: HlyC/CorC family transporter [Verrucomicrobia bacterium]|nr:MAG: HlyC/CorC family transporter [Verrucomicrobiota bacterium]